MSMAKTNEETSFWPLRKQICGEKRQDKKSDFGKDQPLIFSPLVVQPREMLNSANNIYLANKSLLVKKSWR